MQIFYDTLYTRETQFKILQDVQTHIGILETADAKDRASLILLEAQVINSACANPGLKVTHDLFLPLVRERLLAKVVGSHKPATAKVCKPRSIRNSNWPCVPCKWHPFIVVMALPILMAVLTKTLLAKGLNLMMVRNTKSGSDAQEAMWG